MARHSLTPLRGNLMDPFLSLQRGMNRLFDDMFTGAGMPMIPGEGQDAGMLIPQINMSETDKELRVTVELPGVAEEDIEVTLDDDMLTIRGEKKSEKKEEKENYYVVERSFGQFQRSLRVPHAVQADKVQARVENGVLTVVLPKDTAQGKSRRIQVQASKH